MQKQFKFVFSGDSSGNLDVAAPGCETVTEVASSVTEPGNDDKPVYETQMSKSNTTCSKDSAGNKDTHELEESNHCEDIQAIGITEPITNKDLSEDTSAIMEVDQSYKEDTENNGMINEKDLSEECKKDNIDEDKVCNDNKDVPIAIHITDADETMNSLVVEENTREGVECAGGSEENMTDVKDIDDTYVCDEGRGCNIVDSQPHTIDADNNEDVHSKGKFQGDLAVDSEQEMKDLRFGMTEDEEDSEADSDCELPESPATRPATRSTLREVPGGLRAKANTPASQYTTLVDALATDSPGTPKMAQLESMRVASRGSRDEVFQRAMTLMSNRCTSARGEAEELFSHREPPFGVHIPQYFYVQQKRPTPMPPLKVWRGYKGNVYFEPINVSRIQSAPPERNVRSEQSRQPAPTPPVNPRFSRGSTPATRATTANTAQSGRSYRYIQPLASAVPQVFVLDKQALLQSLQVCNEEDEIGAGLGESKDVAKVLRAIEGVESTGSLAVRPLGSNMFKNKTSIQSNQSRTGQDKKLLYKRDRLCRGPNFSAIDRRNKNVGVNNNEVNSQSDMNTSSVGDSRKSSLRMSSRVSAYRPGSRSAGRVLRHTYEPGLLVSGDKFSPPTVMSPVLRASNFSIGEDSEGHRAAANSPDLVDARGMMLDMSGAVSLPHNTMRISMRHNNSPNLENSDSAAGYYKSRGHGKGKHNGTKTLTCSEELKPFIKYSHDVRMNFGDNNTLNYC